MQRYVAVNTICCHSRSSRRTYLAFICLWSEVKDWFCVSCKAGNRHPCTLLYRKAHWMLPDYLVKFVFGNLTRFKECLIHKPGEGLFVWLLATLLSPLVITKHDLLLEPRLLQPLCFMILTISSYDCFKLNSRCGYLLCWLRSTWGGSIR